MSAVNLSAKPVPQSAQSPAQAQPSQGPDDAQKPPQTSASPSDRELPDAPTDAQAVPQEQSDHDASQAQNPGSVPSGAAGAKVPHPNGAPAARPIGSAIAPAKQRGRRSLLIKVGIVAGACVAVGSVVALSKGTSAKPPGAP
jgi:hypothetical protein